MRYLGENPAGADIPDGKKDDFIPLNNIAHSLWKNIIFKIEQATVDSQNGAYPQKAFIYNLLNRSTDGLEHDLQHRDGYYLDNNIPNATDPTKKNVLDEYKITRKSATDKTITNSNLGAVKRNALFRDNKAVDLFSRPCLDAFKSSQYCDASSTMTFILQRMDAGMSVMCPDAEKNKFDYSIDSISLHLKTINVTNGVMEKYLNERGKESQRFPITRLTSNILLPSKTNPFYKAVLFMNQIPECSRHYYRQSEIPDGKYSTQSVQLSANSQGFQSESLDGETRSDKSNLLRR